MSWFIKLAIGVGIIILCGGLVNCMSIYFGARYKKSKKALQAEDQIATRLDEIERRLTDVQDVMIALSEKVDRMESDRHREKLV